jgi:hypothetical protein
MHENFILGRLKCTLCRSGRVEVRQPQGDSRRERGAPVDGAANALGTPLLFMHGGGGKPSRKCGHLSQKSTDWLAEDELNVGEASHFLRLHLE